jgi:hypothetical protein
MPTYSALPTLAPRLWGTRPPHLWSCARHLQPARPRQTTAEASHSPARPSLTESPSAAPPAAFIPLGHPCSTPSPGTSSLLGPVSPMFAARCAKGAHLPASFATVTSRTVLPPVPAGAGPPAPPRPCSRPHRRHGRKHGWRPGGAAPEAVPHTQARKSDRENIAGGKNLLRASSTRVVLG